MYASNTSGAWTSNHLRNVDISRWPCPKSIAETNQASLQRRCKIVGNQLSLAKVSNSTPFNARYNPGVINEGGSLNDIDRLVKLYGYEGLAVPSKSAASMFVPMKLTKPQAIAEALRGRK